jgi:hypothetical protein
MMRIAGACMGSRLGLHSRVIGFKNSFRDGKWGQILFIVGTENGDRYYLL